MRWLLLCVLFLCFAGCAHRPTLFEKISASHSGIQFNNNITESDSLNPMNVVNIYNGGGVGIGDFNNDGLQDIFFTGNQVSSKLYLNKGEFEFQDITNKAGVEGLGRWARGVSVVDINNDGLTDLYICNTIAKDPLKRQNILYVNQGIDNEGIPHFRDMAAEYGLNINVQSTMGYFFDYDSDGDLDMYLVVNEASSGNQNQFGKRITNTPSENGSKGRLYQNQFGTSVNHPVFRDVSAQAGINLTGFGHSASITDINLDGWQDIYVSNDFLSENILYVNNQDGTFTNRAKEYFKHTSFNSMGQDIVDINNDGLEDVVELDMSPEDNYRKKTMMPASNYNTFQNFELYGTQLQYIRNTLQLNRGPRVLENDSIGAPVFSEIGFMSGVAQTDWSWTPVVIDFDNDGYRDMIVTNGFPKDVTDHDFIAYRTNSVAGESPVEMLDKIPEVKLSNYAFRNTDGLTFQNVTGNWGLEQRSFSNGAAYADFDNDGDMDLVINNIDDKALLYRNNIRSKKDTVVHYLQVACTGDSRNISGIGTSIAVYYGGNRQVYEIMPYRGYLSSHQQIAHFGLGKLTMVDSVVVKWPGNRKQTITKVAADQLLKVSITAANEIWLPENGKKRVPALFKEITKAADITYVHKEVDFIDYNIQTTLPHKLSEYSPAIAAGDVDGDGLDDIVIAGNTFNPPSLFCQRPDGRFTEKSFLAKKDSSYKLSKDEGILLFDADGDKDLDLYVASGGFRYESGNVNYQDILYINNGKGQFAKFPRALPRNYTSKLCVKAFDYNKDGKLDLFVSGRVQPWEYPKPVSSFIYRNDSRDGAPKFTDVTADVAPELQNIGMVCDALFSDFDNDNETDLILAGEWMPVIFMKNVHGRFTNVTANSGLADQSGWWTSIAAGDFRHTGRTDYILGNAGANSLYQASAEHPVYITAKDFDKSGGYEAIPSIFLPATDGSLKEFPAHGRDAIFEKMPFMKKRYNDYRSFAVATMDEIFTPDMRKDAIRLKATNLRSCFVRNDGGGRFTMIPLPPEAQMSTLNGMTTGDFNNDGNPDVVINGNDYSPEVSVGRYDALNGLVLQGDGKGNFAALSMQESGVYIPGNGKGIVKLLNSSGKLLMAATQGSGALKLFELQKKELAVRVLPTDMFAELKLENGKTEKVEFYFGDSFLSQSSRFLYVSEQVESVSITDNGGHKRTVQPYLNHSE